MNAMKPKSFWVYTLAGSVAMIVLGLILHFAVFRGYYTTPEYKRYEERQAVHEDLQDAYEDWLEENAKLLEQNEFEEALVGLRDLEDVQDVEARQTAKDLRALTESETALSTKERAEMFQRLLQLPNEQRYSAVRDPMRLSRLLDGEVDAMAPNLPKEIPPKFKELSKEQEKPPERFFAATPRMPLFIEWSTLSLIFALAFMSCGFTSRLEKGEENAWDHPIHTFPHFLLGWIVILATLPGFLTIHLIRLLNMSVVVGVSALVRRFRRGDFEVQLASLGERLEKLRGESKAHGNQVAVARIEKALTLVRKVKDTTLLAEVSEVVGQAEDHAARIEALQELEREYPTPSVTSR